MKKKPTKLRKDVPPPYLRWFRYLDDHIATLPEDPPAAYGDEWRGWNDFLGVDPNSPDGKKNIEQDKLDRERLKPSS